MFLQNIVYQVTSCDIASSSNGIHHVKFMKIDCDFSTQLHKPWCHDGTDD